MLAKFRGANWRQSDGVGRPHTCPEVESLSTADGWRSGRSSETSDAPGNDAGFKGSFIQMRSLKPPGGVDSRHARTSSFTSNEAGAPSPSFTGSGWEGLDVNSLSRDSSRRGLGQGRLIPNMPGSKLSGFSLEGFGVNVRVETGGAGSVMVVGTGLLLVIPRLGLGLFLTTTGLEVFVVVTGLGLFTSTIRFELLITRGGLGLLDILGVITGEEAFGTTGGIFFVVVTRLEIFGSTVFGELISRLCKLNAGGLEVFEDGSGEKRDLGAKLFVLETTRGFSEWALEEVQSTVELDTGAAVVNSSTMWSSSKSGSEFGEGWGGTLRSDTSASGIEGTVRFLVTTRLGSSDPLVDNDSSLTDREPD